jgi:hypothetical protein
LSAQEFTYAPEMRLPLASRQDRAQLFKEAVTAHTPKEVFAV